MHILIASVGCFLPVYLSQVGHVFRPVLFDTFAHPPSSFNPFQVNPIRVGGRQRKRGRAVDGIRRMDREKKGRERKGRLAGRRVLTVDAAAAVR